MPDPARRRVALLATGGTIAGQPHAAGPGYRPGVLDAAALAAAVPGLAELADLRAETLASLGSQNLGLETWLRLAARIRELAAAGRADGIVVTHGTDTLEETAYFLNLVLAPGLPLVLTGAMRPAGAPGADGPANLRDAVAVAADPAAAGRGALVVMNGAIHGARDVAKTSASALCAFASPNRGPLGAVAGGQPLFHAPPVPPPARQDGFPPAWQALEAAGLPRVDILYAHADQPADIVPWLVQRGCRGIVLAGVGAGNAADGVAAALAQAGRQGVAVVRASRTGSGQVARNVEIDDDALGFIAARDLTPQKARILLALALLAGKQGQDLQRCFDRY